MAAADPAARHGGTSSRARLAPLLLILLAAIPLAADGLEVALVAPRSGEAQFGAVTLSAEIYLAQGTASVEFFVDGRAVGSRTEPPYQVTVDVGQANREHHFRVRATDSSGAVAESAVDTPAIRTDLEVDAELQQLYVTVLDAQGRRVLDLTRDDFQILDEGKPQSLVTFARGDVAITAAVLIDASSSMRGRRLEFALDGATRFVEGLDPRDDEASLAIFADHLLRLTPFSADPAKLRAALPGIRAGGGTALADVLYMALKRLEQRQGRRVVVALSDGVDSHSMLGMQQVAWLARRSRALLYWIRPGAHTAQQNYYSAWKSPDDYQADERALAETVSESGGRIVSLESIDRSAAAFHEILQELREQYVLGYYPSNSRDDGSWHRVKVRVDGTAAVVRTREGYIDY